MGGRSHTNLHLGHSTEMPRRTAGALRVVQISTYFPAHGGGLEAVAGRLADAFAADGHCVTWFAGAPLGDLSEGSNLEIQPVCQIDLLEKWFGAPYPLWGPSSLLRLWQAIGRADIVHVHDYIYFGSLAAAMTAILRRRPLVVTQHIGVIPFRNPLARKLLETMNRHVGRVLLSRADAVVYVSQTVARYFAEFVHYRSAPAVIHNGVDHEVYRPLPDKQARQSLRRELSIKDDRTTVLFVGRFVEKKGIPLLREAVLRLPEIDWIFIGWGPMSPLPSGAHNVRVLNHLRGPAVARWYQASDLLVLPSQGEGFPLVVQEALACGTPVAVSEEVQAGFSPWSTHCARVVPIDSPESFASALKSIARDSAWLAASRPESSEFARRWAWSDAAARYLSIFRGLLARSPVDSQ